jgi:phage tail sheath protein FI
LGLEPPVSRQGQAGLNPDGINVIRKMTDGITIWGARTMAGSKEPEWRYISSRRLFNFLRESIDEGTQWVVFEPNAQDLWSKVRRNVGAFLTTVWASGALFGATAEQAFYVRCDETTNPEAVRDLGQLVVEIGVALVKPAEFVVFRISQWSGPA